jgi:hypothetical protein
MRASQGSLFLAVMLLAPAYAAAGGPHHMKEKPDAKADAAYIKAVKPAPGKAALVVGRTMGGGFGAPTFDTYLDRKMIGATKGKGCFVKTDVEPGTYNLISKAENLEVVRIKFEPGRVYYIIQLMRPGVWKARHSSNVVLPEEIKQVYDEDLKLYEYDGSGEDLSEDDYKEAIGDYDRELKEGLHKEHEGYRGAAVE